jgi:hypothetical protein
VPKGSGIERNLEVRFPSMSSPRGRPTTLSSGRPLTRDAGDEWLLYEDKTSGSAGGDLTAARAALERTVADLRGKSWKCVGERSFKINARRVASLDMGTLTDRRLLLVYSPTREPGLIYRLWGSRSAHSTSYDFPVMEAIGRAGLKFWAVPDPRKLDETGKSIQVKVYMFSRPFGGSAGGCEFQD